MPYLGKLAKLLIGHDGRGDASSWKLEMVEVVEEESGKVAFFMADRYVISTAWVYGQVLAAGQRHV